MCIIVKVLVFFTLFVSPIVMFRTPYDQQEYCGELFSQYDPHLLDTFKLEMSQGIERFFLLSYCLACCWPGLGAKSELRVVRQWAVLDFNFPSEEARTEALEKQYFVPGNSVPIDVDVHHRQGALPSRIFVTIPRFDIGRPMTLGTVDENGKLTAYPDYSWHENQGSNCQGMTSVFRIAIDQCQRLWVMDVGKIGDNQVCPPQLLAFDLATDQLIYRHVVNSSAYTGGSLFITPIVDVRPRGPGDCADTFVYAADVSGFGLLIVDIKRNLSWRAVHRYFYPYPSRGTFTIDGESFDLMDGLFGMALSPYQQGRDRYLYFHALAATTENILNTKVIRNDSLLQDPNIDPDAVYAFPHERPSQSAAEAMDQSGILYFGMMDPPSIWCWNTATQFHVKNFHAVAINQETLQFASGLKIVRNSKGEEELWVLTSSFQRVMTGSMSPDRINFRIHAEKVPTILENTPCRAAPKGEGPGHHADIVASRAGHMRRPYRYGSAWYL
ncbi:major royal jelly protein 1-like isoform X1 [Trichoplusia ni]|uniref:Major royal jelly protein 1-like isoform X1 n=2 Tax=Trichoplusia ni TaxID=7111 RepID=A0A7E5VAE9_TRINI|nr:major royal jelly protein 1-like isoform X1 [Trichoplusia ni]XP_026725265.1 major royal jelly protein 1-like isoform X1 [Trichoplusia ni]XP_026725266.1 major royal jelly protein 1-like isoform X1 [Trichoplusia ni]